MTYFDKYKKRLGSYGDSLGDAYSDSTKEIVNSSFKDSPSFENIGIGFTDSTLEMTDVRIVDSDTGNPKERKLLLRPDTSKMIGEYALFHNGRWLITEFKSSSITPKVDVRLLDNLIKWRDHQGLIVEQPCSLKSFTLETLQDSEYFLTNENNIRMIMQYNDLTKTIVPDQRFIFGSNVYQIIGIDDYSYITNGKGTMLLSLEMTEKNSKDNFVDGVADNSHLYDTSSGTDGGGDWL